MTCGQLTIRRCTERDSEQLNSGSEFRTHPVPWKAKLNPLGRLQDRERYEGRIISLIKGEVGAFD